MSLFQWILGHGGRRQRIEELTEQLAAKCAAEVHPLLNDQALRMSPHEQRGYVRAHATGTVKRVTLDASRLHQIPTNHQQYFYVQVLEATIRRIQRQLHARSLMVRARRAA